MSDRRPTPEQSAAIGAGERTVMLEAGAGTGKTGVMVERYCRLVCEGGISPDAVLAFTFTDKAAAELRERIRAAVEERAAGGSERARELLPVLGGAWITTIHGFCNRLLAGHPVAVGIDPGFRVLDAAEAERVASEAFERALESFLAAGDPERERTVAAFGIDSLGSLVAGVHAELRSRGDADPRLPDPPSPHVAGALADLAKAAQAAIEECKPGNSNGELLERALAVLAEGGDGGPTLDQLAELRTDSSAKSMAAYRAAAEAAVSRAAEAGEGGLAYRHVATLLEIFGDRFAAAKQRRAGVDFEDLQILAVRLLERTETGAHFRSRFTHLLVDEFQDTNRLQLRLIEALRGPAARLMVVGDELQSIYGFRHADLDVFRAQREEIDASADARAIGLSGNFRSRPEVIGAINALGEILLGERFRELRVGAEQPPDPAGGDGAAVELILTGRDGWDEEGIDLDPATDARTPANALAEARALAARLRDLVDAGVERGQIVVLLRAFTHLDAYEDSLERAGLRPYVVGGRGYWSQQQVADVCAMLATIVNPLDDQALFGALASPACGVAPDTLWLLRAAAGRGRHVWPAVERVAGIGGEELAEPERLEAIPGEEAGLLRGFATAHAALRERAVSLTLAGLIDAAVTETGYDLAVLMRPIGEARYANVRKLMRLADEYEAAEGRDLRGLLDFLAARADADADAQAATAVEGHDGVRIMTVHSAKGLEFDVVAVPHLSRSLLAGSRPPVLSVGREAEAPRVGMQLRRLGARAVNLYAHKQLCEESQRRDAEEELRLFHVAATRARRRLVLSGIVRPEPPRETTPGTSVVERIATAFGVDRESDSTIVVPAPQPREGLDRAFAPSEIRVTVNLASPQQAAELTALRRGIGVDADPGEGPAPLLERRPAPPPKWPLSYTAITGREESVAALARMEDDEDEGGASERDSAAARGIAVHSLLEWSHANDWIEPPAEIVGRFALAAGLDPDADVVIADLLGAIRAWLGSDFFAERIEPGGSVRTEVPLLLDLDGTLLRGSIDLLVEREGDPPLIVDFKTDRLEGVGPAERAGHYQVQRDLYATAVAEARQADEVEVAYVFLEVPDEPVIETASPTELLASRRRTEAAVALTERLKLP